MAFLKEIFKWEENLEFSFSKYKCNFHMLILSTIRIGLNKMKKLTEKKLSVEKG